jgi:pimeloyl-ACP methyl ester carboxylesterase
MTTPEHSASPPDGGRRFLLAWRGHWISGAVHGAGDPLLLIMGLGGCVEMWEPLIPHLPGRRLIAFDAPGTGRSSLPMIAVTVPELADLAAAVLDHLDVARADVLGFSYGGAVAQQLALQHPHRVDKMVLVATTCGVGTEPVGPRAASALASPWRYYYREYFKRTAPLVYGGLVGRDEDVQDRLFHARAQRPPHPYGYFLQLVGGSEWSSLSFLGDLVHVTLVLVGDQDPLVPVAAAQQLADAIPHGRAHILPGAGHLLLLDEPERSGSVVSAFLDGTVTQACSSRRA